LFVVASDCKERGDPGFWIASSLSLLAKTVYAMLSLIRGREVHNNAFSPNIRIPIYRLEVSDRKMVFRLDKL
ncbi:MAG: hypothetical protein COW89_07095, partial [Nitrospinae bacterium CG22_combo_CG10-13_8_21_14_all_47_10]